ncbi:MAG: hypothetical protein LBB48_01435, partial [Treponema sp.]|nr:hypothetical protein [Treponema sp.]
MEISIDGCVLDVTLEHERTVGELFLSLETWLSGTGFRPAAFELNGRKISAGDVADAFATGL